MAAAETDPLMPSAAETEIPKGALVRAEHDLDWWYGVRQGALGLHAAGLESGSRAWEGLLIPTADAGMLMVEASIVRLASKQRSEDGRKWRRVARTLRGMRRDTLRLAEELYRPRNASLVLRALFPAPPILDVALAPRQGGDVNLVGLVPFTAAFRRAYSQVDQDRVVVFSVESWQSRAVACNARVRRGSHELAPLEWLDDVVRPKVKGGKVVNDNPPKWTKTARAEASDMRLAIVREYAEARFRSFRERDPDQ